MLTFKAFKLTPEEISNPMNLGYKYAFENKSKWVDLVPNPVDQISTYDVGTTYLVLDGSAYTIYKDYIIVEDSVRLFILLNNDLESDKPIEIEVNP